MAKRFLRVDSLRMSRLGRGRRKLQKWRRPRGKSNKLRLRRQGYSKIPEIGYKSPRKTLGKIGNLTPVLVHNLGELEKLSSSEGAIIARVGARKKIDIIKKANEKKIRIFNLGGKQ